MKLDRIKNVEGSFLFLFFLSSAGLLPGQVFVLDVLDSIVEPDELLLFIFLLIHFPAFSFFPFELAFFFFLVPLLEDFELLVGFLNQLIQFIDLLVEFVLALLGFGGELLRPLLDFQIFSMQILF
jgi:hypothetical protein